MNGLIANLFLMTILAEVKDSAPQLFHKCPYQGSIDVYNLTTDSQKAFDVFPEGIYRLNFSVFKGSKEVFVLMFDHDQKSPLKHSMG